MRRNISAGDLISILPLGCSCTRKQDSFLNLANLHLMKAKVNTLSHSKQMKNIIGLG